MHKQLIKKALLCGPLRVPVRALNTQQPLLATTNVTTTNNNKTKPAARSTQKPVAPSSSTSSSSSTVSASSSSSSSSSSASSSSRPPPITPLTHQQQQALLNTLNSNPTPDALHQLITDYSLAPSRFLSNGIAALKSFRSKSVVPNEATLILLLKMCRHSADLTSCTTIWDMISSGGSVSSSSLLESYVCTLLVVDARKGSSQWPLIANVIQQVYQQNISVQPALAVALLDACTRGKQHVEAERLYSYVESQGPVARGVTIALLKVLLVSFQQSSLVSFHAHFNKLQATKPLSYIDYVDLIHVCLQQSAFQASTYVGVLYSKHAANATDKDKAAIQKLFDIKQIFAYYRSHHMLKQARQFVDHLCLKHSSKVLIGLEHKMEFMHMCVQCSKHPLAIKYLNQIKQQYFKHEPIPAKQLKSLFLFSDSPLVKPHVRLLIANWFRELPADALEKEEVQKINRIAQKAQKQVQASLEAINNEQVNTTVTTNPSATKTDKASVN